jgi:hypothetical protein
MALDPKYTDPVARFQDLFALARGAPSPPDAAQLQPQRLVEIIGGAANRQSVPTDLARHIALHTNLTQNVAENLVNATLPQGGSAQDQANAVSAAATGLAFNADVEFSDPVMLWPMARVWFSAALASTLALTVILTFVLALTTTNVGTAAYAALAVPSALSLIGILVLVMGYKNVTIKGGTPSSSG